MGERQRKSTTLINRVKIRFYEQALTHGHKAVGKAGQQCHPLSPCTSPYSPLSTPQYTTKPALVQARPGDINIGLRFPVPNEQAAECTCLVEGLLERADAMAPTLGSTTCFIPVTNDAAPQKPQQRPHLAGK